ncbi:MAG: glycosyl transferase [Frankiales bacterium]|nr:glycosyl transferase [Frankiales bacterium]
MNVGGPAELLVQLLGGLPDQELLTGDVEEGEADHLALRAPTTPYTRVPGLGRSPRPGDDARALAFLVRELRRRRPDVVHTHTAKAGVLGRVAGELARVPHLVHTFHGHLLHGYFGPGVTRAVTTSERLLARRTERLVAVGTQVRDDLLAAGVGRPQQYVVVPPGVTMPAVDRAAARAALGVHGPVVATVGRLIGVKRPDRLLEVARLLPDVTFLMAGDGPLLAVTRAAAPPNVRFLGWQADVARVHAAADVALLTSDNEGMPVSLVEAALCGTPAVSTDVGSAREVVVGEVVAPDAAALAAAVRRVLAQPGLGEVARTRAQERFSVAALCAAHRELYASL